MKIETFFRFMMILGLAIIFSVFVDSCDGGESESQSSISEGR